MIEQTGNLRKRVLEATKPVYANNTREPIIS